ncbi:MAG: cysteine--tRNA ligase [Acidobacteriota bacterium]
MKMKLYNTLTQEVGELVPLRDNEIRMYTCGPTVHDYAHIGNFRTFVQFDILRRTLKYFGFALTHLMNITDVDDNIISKSTAANMSLGEYTEIYASAFLEDMKTLRIQQPEVMPRPTEHIQAMVDLILKLREKGFTYESEGSTYFRIDRFPEYGKLAHLERRQGEAVGRIDSDRYDKENPRDFVLWKARKPGEAYWDTPMGPGRPGWHIECSAMSMAHLGPTFDIHCGGADLVFPHHENEIAQSEAATGQPFVMRWLHCEFLMVNGQKMSKSLGNYYTLRDLLQKGYNPLAIRYLLASVHYRKQLNFTLDGLEQATAALQRVNDFVIRLREIPDDRPANTELSERTRQALAEFEAGLADDVNTSAALASVFELVRDTNPLLERNEVGSQNRDHILKFLSAANQIFDVFQVEEQRLEDEEVVRWIEERRQARFRRDFKRADEIRRLLAERGVALEDTKEGTRWKRVI